MNKKTDMSSTTQEKKPFDSTICFTFFGSWAESIFELESEEDKNSDAYVLFKAIAECCLYGKEPDFEGRAPWMRAVWRMVEQQADTSIARRKRGFAAEEPSEEHEAIIDASAENPDASIRNIAGMLGSSKSTVQRVQVKYKDLIEERKNLLKDDEADEKHLPPPGMA